MGSTPIYALPFPELSAPANPPPDFQKLAAKVETVIAAIPRLTVLPASQARVHTTTIVISATAATAGAEYVSIKNPQTAAKMLVRVVAHGWVVVPVGSIFCCYVGIRAGTTPTPVTVAKSRTRVEASTAQGAVHREFFCESTFYVAAGATGMFTPFMNKSGTSNPVIDAKMALTVDAVNFTTDTLPAYPAGMP